LQITNYEMYDLNDTIVAVSSPSMGARTIVRISGPATINICKQIFSPSTANIKSGLAVGSIRLGRIDTGLKIDAILYLFPAPFSYTGDDVAEIHVYANRSVTEQLCENLLAKGLRLAGPGEFTARAYLNGKIDLAQAEAVNEVVVSSNTFQLAAAEKLLSGRLSETATKVQAAMMDCLSLIEAGLDFSGEEIEEYCRVGGLIGIKQELEQLLAGSIRCESVVDLPAVGIAGAPNAGKSSLLNKLLGQERSIVSNERQTTRDVLTGLLTLSHCRCVLFDCAGLTRCSILPPSLKLPTSLALRRTSRRTSDTSAFAEASDFACATPDKSADKRYSILDELAQGAAIEALRNSSTVIFCVDIAKENWSEDVAIRQLIQPKVLIPVATKSDLLSKEMLANRIAELNKIFGLEFLPTSVVTSAGIEALISAIDTNLLELSLGKIENSCASEVALTVRHRQAVADAIENINEAINELKAGSDEMAAMMVRAAYQAICDIGQPAEGRVDDQVLERIFSRFCIGK
jgi:tRNA modification GTPase